MAPKVTDQYKEEKRNDLIRSALACFGEKGYEATSVDDIIRHAGVSKGMLYTYFASKEEILLQLLKQRTQKFLEDVRSDLSRLNSCMDQVLVLIRRYQDKPFTEDQKQWSTVYLEFWIAASRHPERNQFLSERYDLLIRFLADIIEEGKSRGEFIGNLDSWTASKVYWALCDGAILHTMNGVDSVHTNAMWKAAEEMLIRYLSNGL